MRRAVIEGASPRECERPSLADPGAQWIDTTRRSNARQTRDVAAEVALTQALCTHSLCDMKNITLSVDDQVLEQARRAADRRGKSLNALIRDYLEELAGVRRRSAAAERLKRLWSEGTGRSGGRKFTRDSLYEDRT